MKNTYRFALTGLLASTAILAARGAGAEAGPIGTPTIEATATPTEIIMIEPEPPPPTSVPAPGATKVPGKQTVAPAESPRVLWVRSSHAGPGVMRPCNNELRATAGHVAPNRYVW